MRSRSSQSGRWTDSYLAPPNDLHHRHPPCSSIIINSQSSRQSPRLNRMYHIEPYDPTACTAANQVTTCGNSFLVLAASFYMLNTPIRSPHWDDANGMAMRAAHYSQSRCGKNGVARVVVVNNGWKYSDFWTCTRGRVLLSSLEWASSKYLHRTTRALAIIILYRELIYKLLIKLLHI